LYSAKALYRRALCYTFLKDEEAALKDLEAAAALVPSDGAVKKELDGAKKRKEERRAKERKAYGKMFG